MKSAFRLLATLVALVLAAPALAQTVYVRAGHLIEPSSGEVLDDRLIRIEDGRVAAVTPWSPPPADARVIDWSAYWVLPGLIDVHVHLADFLQTSDPAEPLKHSPEETAYLGARNARLTLEAGFTTAHDVGSYRGTGNIELRNAINRGDVIGPRINAVGGYITKPGGGGGEVTGLPKGTRVPPEMRMGVVRSPAEVTAKVNLLLDKGADSIKLIAHRRGSDRRNRTGRNRAAGGAGRCSGQGCQRARQLGDRPCPRRRRDQAGDPQAACAGSSTPA